MKFILKILFAPVIAALAVIIWILAFVLKLSAWFFGILGTIFGILILVFVSPIIANFALKFGPAEYFSVSVFALTLVVNGIIVLVFAFLVSPLGLPMLAAWLIGQMQRFRYFVQDAVYG